MKRITITLLQPKYSRMTHSKIYDKSYLSATTSDNIVNKDKKTKELRRLKIKHKNEEKKQLKSKSIQKSTSGDLRHGVLTFWAAPAYGLYPPLGLPPTLAQSISPPGDEGPWTLKRSKLSGCWQMHRYIYNKYFVNKLTTLSLYKKIFINNNIVDKIKWIY